MDIVMTLVVLIVTAALISMFMEVYKKRFRKDQAKRGEIYLVALVVTVGAVVTGYRGLEFVGTAWVVPLYAFLVFTVQFFLNMEIIKAVAIRHVGMRKKEVEEADCDLCALKVLIRLADRLHYIDKQKFGQCAMYTAELGKIIGGWTKSLSTQGQ